MSPFNDPWEEEPSLTEPTLVRDRGNGGGGSGGNGSGGNGPPSTPSTPSSRGQAAPPNKPGDILGRRYRVMARLGRGGTGTVYRAQDLLGGPVAIKRLDVSREEISHGDTASVGISGTSHAVLSLAHEFQMLASLRHPHVITVLDYGFDERQRPYLVLDLIEDAQTIVEAAAGKPIGFRVGLLLQLLQALAYLHRRGLIHRDLKPGNVLVTQGQVKVLDFGLALATKDHAEGISGTPGYLAPEVLAGKAPSEASDLYAVGVIALKLLTEPEAPDTGEPTASAVQTPNRPHRVAGPHALPHHLPTALALVLERLLAPDPKARYETAEAALKAFCEATGQPVPSEAATRESFLQAARYVGREQERTRLEELLAKCLGGQGHPVLVAGESGVGKSRLLDELRTLALVRGTLVLRGGAISDGASPYHAWRSVLRWLTILAELDELESSVLKPLVPDLEGLLGRAVPDAGELSGEVAQARLLSVIEGIFRRVRQPTVVIIEDLHWADTETLRLFSRLAAVSRETPLLLLGTYRDDERDVTRELHGVEVLRLKRLGMEQIAALAESMIGAPGQSPELLQLLHRETEGNPFFLVEVVRALAEEAGTLDSITGGALPQTVVAGGVQAIVQRRLAKVPADAREALQLAAIMGRQLDEAALRSALPALDADRLLADCADAAVLDVADGQWRFAHDKLRDALLATLPEGAAARLHRQAAQAIEAAHPEDTQTTAALAFHWGQAGDTGREAHYLVRAGTQALRVGACADAERFLDRALELEQARLAHPGAPREARHAFGQLEALRAEVYFQLGKTQQFVPAAERALRELGWGMPRHAAGMGLSTFWNLLLGPLQRAWPSLFADGSADRRARRIEAGRIHRRLTDHFMYSQQALALLWSGLRTIGLCEPAGPSAELARGYSTLAMLLGVLSMHRLSMAWCERSLGMAERVGTQADQADILVRNSVCYAFVGDWAVAEEHAQRAIRIIDGMGDYRLAEECRLCLALVSLYQFKLKEALELGRWLEDSTKRRGAEGLAFGPLTIACSLLRLGRSDEALPVLEQLAAFADKETGVQRLTVSGTLALARLRQGDEAGALAAVKKTLENSPARPIAHFTQLSVAAAADTALTLLARAGAAAPDRRKELRDTAAATCKAMRAFAKAFPFGAPFASLWEGNLAWLDGKARAAHEAWGKAISEAQALSLPYEEARARFELARTLPSGTERVEHLGKARDLFTTIGAADELGWVREELLRSV